MGDAVEVCGVISGVWRMRWVGGFESVVVWELSEEGVESGGYAAFPVYEGAVDVEGEGAEGGKWWGHVGLVAYVQG